MLPKQNIYNTVRNLTFNTVFILLLVLVTPAVHASKPDKTSPKDKKAEEANYFSGSLHEAHQAYEKRNYKKSLQTLKKASLTPKFREQAKLLLLKGMSYYRMRDCKKALSALDQSLKLRRSSSDTLYFKAKCHLLQGEQSIAVKVLEEAIWFNRFNIINANYVNYELARIFQGAGLQEKAETYYKKASQGDLLESQDVLFLSAQLMERGNKTQAIDILRSELKKDPENSDIKHGLASSLLTEADWLLNRQDIKEANQLLKDIVTDEAGQTNIQSPYFSTYVRSLLLSKKISEAKQHVLVASKHMPNSEVIQELNEQIKIEELSEMHRTAKASLTTNTNN